MESKMHCFENQAIFKLKTLIGKDFDQIEFRELIPSGKAGVLPITIRTSNDQLTLTSESSEFPITPSEYWPMSYFAIAEERPPRRTDSDRIIFLHGREIKNFQVVRTRVVGSQFGVPFMSITADTGLFIEFEEGSISLQKTYLDDFGVDIELIESKRVADIVIPNFHGEEDLEYRYESTGELISLKDL